MEGKSTNRRDSEMKQMNKYQSRKELVALWHSLCTLLLRRETDVTKIKGPHIDHIYNISVYSQSNAE